MWLLLNDGRSAPNKFAEPRALYPNYETRFFRIRFKPIGFQGAEQLYDGLFHGSDVLNRLQQPMPETIICKECEWKLRGCFLRCREVPEDLGR